jgi:hypothetical protein
MSYGCGHKHATLDQDAALVETHKAEALFSYKHFRAYQPLNTYWAEHDLMLHSEFRDGNVPAGFEQLRVLQDALALLPDDVETVSLRSDSAGYQTELLAVLALFFAFLIDAGPVLLSWRDRTGSGAPRSGCH